MKPRVKNTLPAFLNLKYIEQMKKVNYDGQLLEFLLFFAGIKADICHSDSFLSMPRLEYLFLDYDARKVAS